MVVFRYASVRPDGKKVKGLVEAPNLEEAKKRLQEQEMCLLALRPSRRRHSHGQLRGKILLEIIEQLASLLNVGMPLYESLRELTDQHRTAPYHTILSGLCDQLQCGASLAQAMRQYPHSFSDLVIAMVDAGQAAGQLPMTLETLAQLLRQQQQLQKQLLNALLYPIILLSFSTILVISLLTFLIPSLESLFEDRPVHGLTKCVFYLSHGLTQGWPFLLIGLAALVLGIHQFIHSQVGRHWIETKTLRLPWIGSFYIQKEIGRFSHLMAVMLQGGVPLLPALQIARASLHFRSLRATFVNIEQKIIEGRLLSQELKHHTWVPHLMIRLLSLGEESGQLSKMFEKLSAFYEAEVEKILTRVTTLAQPLLLLSMGIVVGLIMMAVLLPLTDIKSFM